MCLHTCVEGGLCTCGKLVCEGRNHVLSCSFLVAFHCKFLNLGISLKMQLIDLAKLAGPGTSSIHRPWIPATLECQMEALPRLACHRMLRIQAQPSCVCARHFTS